MELMNVLQAILDKAGNKDFYITGRVRKENGDVASAEISLCKIYKSTDSKGAVTIGDYDKDRAGKVTITETEEKETKVRASKSMASEIKSKLKI